MTSPAPDGEPEPSPGTAAAPRPRYRWRMVAAAAAAVALAAAVVAVAMRPGAGEGDDAEAVVRSYLEAVRDRDVAAALRIAGNPQTTGENEDDSFLIADALSSDWEIVHVVRRTPEQNLESAQVDVILRTSVGDEHRGRFSLTNRSSRWAIDNPFGELSLIPTEVFAHLDLNGVVRAWPSEADELTTYLLFPGPYQPYANLAGLVDQDPLRIVALPPVGPRLFWQDLTFHQGGHETATQAIAEYLDECVTLSVSSPPDCPFGTEDAGTSIVGERYYDDAEVTSWEMITYPEVLLVLNGYGIEIIERRIGVVQVTGTGKPLGEETRTNFQADCRVDLSKLTITVSDSGNLTASGESTDSTCWDGALSR